MKLCLIAPLPPFRGGIAKYCHSLALELEKRHELLLLSYRRQYPKILYGRKNQIDQDVDKKTILAQFNRLSYDMDSANPLSWRRTAREIGDFKPEMVIIPWWVAYWTPLYLYLLLSLKRRGIKVLFLCINVYEHEGSRLKNLLTRFVLGKVHRIIVHSRQERQEIMSFNTTATVRTELLPLFEYDVLPMEKVDSRLHLLFFGFVRSYKGLDTLLRALALLKDCDILLKVAGEFWCDKNEYLDLIRELDLSAIVELVDGYVSPGEMGRQFAWADLVILPYKKSITSGVLATAYGFGKPVLATDVGGFCELLLDGCTGKLVPPDNPRALADGVRWFLENRDLDFAGNISAFTREKMSWSSLVNTIEEFVRET